MLRRLSALVGILVILCILASLLWTVYLHRVHAHAEPDDTVEGISSLSMQPPVIEEFLNV